MNTRYHPTGLDRDSYISGVRPGARFGAFHDVSKRRDNLPDSVFATLRDGVVREERTRMIEGEVRARARLKLASGKGGKRMINNTPADRQANVDRMEAAIELRDRSEALRELYAFETAQWEEMLGQRGLASMRV